MFPVELPFCLAIASPVPQSRYFLARSIELHIVDHATVSCLSLSHCSIVNHPPFPRPAPSDSALLTRSVPFPLFWPSLPSLFFVPPFSFLSLVLFCSYFDSLQIRLTALFGPLCDNPSTSQLAVAFIWHHTFPKHTRYSFGRHYTYLLSDICSADALAKKIHGCGWKWATTQPTVTKITASHAKRSEYVFYRLWVEGDKDASGRGKKRPCAVTAASDFSLHPSAPAAATPHTSCVLLPCPLYVALFLRSRISSGRLLSANYLRLRTICTIKR